MSQLGQLDDAGASEQHEEATSGASMQQSVLPLSVATLSFASLHSHSLTQTVAIGAATASLSSSCERLMDLVAQMRLQHVQQQQQQQQQQQHQSNTASATATDADSSRQQSRQQSHLLRSELLRDVSAAILAMDQHVGRSLQRTADSRKESSGSRSEQQQYTQSHSEYAAAALSATV